MIRRDHQAGNVTSHALWSDCGGYRYGLCRRWADGPELNYVMLNPSKATEAHNDATIERCQRRATALGFGAFSATNLFAYCATDPRDLKAAAEPVGPENDVILAETAGRADMVLCAWGVHGAHLGRADEVAKLLAGRPLHVLGLSKAGHPRHPLYVPYAAKPLLWQS